MGVSSCLHGCAHPTAPVRSVTGSVEVHLASLSLSVPPSPSPHPDLLSLRPAAQVRGVTGSVEVDYVGADEAVHVSMNLFCMRDYRLGWLLLLPAVNYVRGKWAAWRAGGGEAEEGEWRRGWRAVWV